MASPVVSNGFQGVPSSVKWISMARRGRPVARRGRPPKSWQPVSEKTPTHRSPGGRGMPRNPRPRRFLDRNREGWRNPADLSASGNFQVEGGRSLGRPPRKKTHNLFRVVFFYFIFWRAPFVFRGVLYAWTKLHPEQSCSRFFFLWCGPPWWPAAPPRNSRWSALGASGRQMGGK